VKIAWLVAHASTSAPQELSLRATSIQLILMFAPSVELVQTFVLLRLFTFLSDIRPF